MLHMHSNRALKSPDVTSKQKFFERYFIERCSNADRHWRKLISTRLASCVRHPLIPHHEAITCRRDFELFFVLHIYNCVVELMKEQIYGGF